jgi:hypothetical protein
VVITTAVLVLQKAEGESLLCSRSFLVFPEICFIGFFLWTWDRFFNEIRPWPQSRRILAIQRKKAQAKKEKKDRGSLRLRLPTQQPLLMPNQPTAASHQLL